MCFVNYISTKIVEIPDFTIEFEQEDHLSKLEHKSISAEPDAGLAVLTIKIKAPQLLFSPGEISQSQECSPVQSGEHFLKTEKYNNLPSAKERRMILQDERC